MPVPPFLSPYLFRCQCDVETERELPPTAPPPPTAGLSAVITVIMSPDFIAVRLSQEVATLLLWSWIVRKGAAQDGGRRLASDLSTRFPFCRGGGGGWRGGWGGVAAADDTAALFMFKNLLLARLRLGFQRKGAGGGV